MVFHLLDNIPIVGKIIASDDKAEDVDDDNDQYDKIKVVEGGCFCKAQRWIEP